MKKISLALILAVLTVATNAQSPIEDNSFLLEEAYNQEKGVIQYISTFYRQRGGNWGYSFTNELPVKKQQHQFSYTLNVARNDGSTGFGDTYLNYRYQAAGLGEEDKIAVAPRFSVILPTGVIDGEQEMAPLEYSSTCPSVSRIPKRS